MPHPFDPHDDAIHLWRIDLNAPTPPDVLSGQEHARAACLRFPQDQARWSASRAALRGILGQYLSRPPQSLAFACEPHGRPRLADGRDHARRRFNLSHSHTSALLAVTNGREIGVDIERIRTSIDPLELATSVFAPDEIALLKDAPADTRHALFFTFWTAKEALVKAHGAGLSLPTTEFSVAALACTDSTRALGFAVRTQKVETGYAAAVAARCEDMPIHHFEWLAS